MVADEQDGATELHSAGSLLPPGASGSGHVARGQLTHLVVGRVVGPRGLHGELKVEIESDDPARFHALRKVYLGDDLTPFAVDRARLFKGRALLQLAGIADRNTAELWRGAYVYVEIADALPLGEDEYYFHEVEGLAVVTENGTVLGRVTDILPTGANDVYVVNGPDGELLLPAIKEVVIEVDTVAGTMLVRLPDGLRSESS